MGMIPGGALCSAVQLAAAFKSTSQTLSPTISSYSPVTLRLYHLQPFFDTQATQQQCRLPQ